MNDYVVDVKRSARRTNAAVGAVVCQRGTRQRFGSRAEAEAWAAGLSEGDANVWVRAANPDDSTGADAYLIGWIRPRRLGEETLPGDQSGLTAYER